MPLIPKTELWLDKNEFRLTKMTFTYREYRDATPNLLIERIAPEGVISEIYMFPIRGRPTPSNTGTNTRNPADKPNYDRFIQAILFGVATVAIVGGALWMWRRKQLGLPPFERRDEPFDPITPVNAIGAPIAFTLLRRNGNYDKDNIPNQTNRKPPLQGIAPNPLRPIDYEDDQNISFEVLSVARVPPLAYPSPVNIIPL
jgi:hypothetical protein